MKLTGQIIWVALLVGVLGCAERVSIKSYPPGAKAYLDDQYLGTTPILTSLPRSQVGKNHTWRIEYGDCDPATGPLRTRVGAGRIVGYAFTLGISAIFKGPRAFRPVDVALSGEGCSTRSAARPENPLVVTIPPAAREPDDDVRDVAKRLETLRDLHDRGLLSEAEYRIEKERALDELE